MGEYKMIPEAMDLRNNIVELTGKEPSPTLFSLLGALTQSAKEITSRVLPNLFKGQLRLTNL
jgi:hypothetical protein